MRVKSGKIKRIIPRNRNLEALSEEELHPALIEKDDLIMITGGMLPFDGFLERGKVKVMENAQFGWESIESKSKGHKLISGS
jgi:hypothetical protein